MFASSQQYLALPMVELLKYIAKTNCTNSACLRGHFCETISTFSGCIQANPFYRKPSQII
jgi:hypothetical protein